jgi:hypothetical protein
LPSLGDQKGDRPHGYLAAASMLFHLLRQFPAWKGGLDRPGGSVCTNIRYPTGNGPLVIEVTDTVSRFTLNVFARLRIFSLGCLIALLLFSDPNGGVLDIPMSFILKNQMHMEAHELAKFRLIASIPLYLSFMFGLFRDSWSSKTIRDPGIIGVLSLLSAALYLTLALFALSYFTILLAALFVLRATDIQGDCGMLFLPSFPR